MNELRSTEILDKEIQADAGKKQSAFLYLQRLNVSLY